MIRFLRAAAVAVLPLAAVAMAVPAASAATSGTVTATTAFVARTDSGNHGNWATDAFTRTAKVTPGGLVVSPSCGSLGAQCYKFTGSVSDKGTFATIAGNRSPQAGVAMKAVSGTLAGGWSSFTFYADSNTVSASGVPGHVNGNGGTSTSDWLTQFFPAGTHFAVNGAKASPIGNWAWTYKAGATCEQWVDSATNSDGSVPADGDITGVSQCKPSSIVITASAKCGTWKGSGWSIWYHPAKGAPARTVTVWNVVRGTLSKWDTSVRRTEGQFGRIHARNGGIAIGYWANGKYTKATYVLPGHLPAC